MNPQQKRKLAADLLAGRKKFKDLQKPGGIVIIRGDVCRINTALGEQEVSLDQLEKIRGEGQTLIFLPENNR